MRRRDAVAQLRKRIRFATTDGSVDVSDGSKVDVDDQHVVSPVNHTQDATDSFENHESTFAMPATHADIAMTVELL